MSSLQMDSQNGRGKNKRFWRKDEEETLLNCLLELSLDPCWKGEGGFKNGFTKKVEHMMNVVHPGCGLLADPHIESKVKWFREKYVVVNEMLSKTSGFQWNDEEKIVQCERQAYDDFCKTHPKARGLFNVPFPFLDKLELIFGVDRANGKRCELPTDSVNNMEKETINLALDDDDVEFSVDGASRNDDFEEVQRPSKKQKTHINSSGKGKARMGSNTHSEELNEINHMTSDFAGFMNNISNHLESMTTTMSNNYQLELRAAEEVRASRRGLAKEMAAIPGLTKAQGFRAAILIGASISDMDIFYSLDSVESKKEYVLELLKFV